MRFSCLCSALVVVACGDDRPAMPAEAGPNRAPTLVAQRPDPAMPLVLGLAAGQGGATVELDLTDPDAADRLFLRLFADYDRPNPLLQRQTTAPPPSSAGAVRTVTFRNLSCADLGIGDSTPATDGGTPGLHKLEIVVSDRDFDDGEGAPINRRPMADAFLVVASWPFFCRSTPAGSSDPVVDQHLQLQGIERLLDPRVRRLLEE